MYRCANRFRLKSGNKEEYKRRHDEIWPEMIEIMNKAGIHNYSIWNVENELFQYFETEDKEKCFEILAQSDVIKRWDKYMEDLIEKDIDHRTSQMKEMTLMFFHK